MAVTISIVDFVCILLDDFAISVFTYPGEQILCVCGCGCEALTKYFSDIKNRGRWLADSRGLKGLEQ